MREAARLGLEEHVTFLGFLTGKDLWRIFRTADIGCARTQRTPSMTI